MHKRGFALRKPPFCPLNYGNNDSFDSRFSIADCKQLPRHVRCYPRYPRNLQSNFLLLASTHQRHKPAAAGDFEFAEDRVEVLFHHRQTQPGVIGDLLVAPALADKLRNLLFAPGQSDKSRQSQTIDVNRKTACRPPCRPPRKKNFNFFEMSALKIFRKGEPNRQRHEHRSRRSH